MSNLLLADGAGEVIDPSVEDKNVKTGAILPETSGTKSEESGVSSVVTEGDEEGRDVQSPSPKTSHRGDSEFTNNLWPVWMFGPKIP